jgi:hypothetical protein
MNFWTTLWAVFIALYVMEEIKRYRRARERSGDYCHKEAVKYEWMTKMMYAAGQERSAQQYAERCTWWEKQARSWIPIHPTQSEQDCEIEQSQDDAIRAAMKDWEVQYAKQQADKR